MVEHSGAHWCSRFPGSALLDDLEEPFRHQAKTFVTALRAAGALVTVAATYRPPERAYLMHFACLVAGYRDKAQVFHQISTADVPPFAGVDIDFSCGGDRGAAIAAAVAMVKGYGIEYPAALVSNHTRRKAVDMTVHWQGVIHVQDAHGAYHDCVAQRDLWPVGESYGVIKLPSDPPHWSVDGH